MFKQLYLNITLAEALVLMPKYQKMLKALLSNKEKLLELANTPLNENCSAVILKKLPEKLGDPGKFLNMCGFSELKCKALADLGASINLMPLSIWKELGLPDLTRMTLELANRAICTPDGIARDVFVPVGKFTFPVDFVVVGYESDPRVPLILGRPFLRTARALIDVHDIDSINDIYPYFDHNPLSGSTTSSSNLLLEEFTDELARKDSSLKDSIDQMDLANLDDYFVDPTPEMFTDEHAPDNSSPSRFDVYDDDFLEVESDADNVNDDPFDSKGEKIKESKLLIDELDFLCDYLPYSVYDSFNSQNFSNDDLPSTNNEDKVFNPGILIQEKSIKIITRVAQEKKLAISYASLVFEDIDPPFYEPLFFKDVPKSMMLLLFSFENEEKVFKLGIYTSKKLRKAFTFRDKLILGIPGTEANDRVPIEANESIHEVNLKRMDSQHERFLRSNTLGRESCFTRNTSIKHRDVEEIEMPSEAYFVQIGTLNKLSTLWEYVEDTEDYINIMLDGKQNRLLQMGVILSTAGLIINAGLSWSIWYASIYMDSCCTTGSIFFYVVANAWCKQQRLLE
nr:magnesium transporter MRS2-D [Tanacetum cinerariifolium]